MKTLENIRNTVLDRYYTAPMTAPELIDLVFKSLSEIEVDGAETINLSEPTDNPLISQFVSYTQTAPVAAQILQLKRDIQRLEEELTSRIEAKADASERIYNDLERKYFDVVNENAELKQQLKEAVEVIEKLLNKTKIYQSIYHDDKWLKKYREDAESFLTKLKGGG